MGQKHTSNNNSGLSEDEQLAKSFVNIFLGILFILPVFLAFYHWCSLNDFAASLVWRLSSVSVPSNTVYGVLPYGLSDLLESNIVADSFAVGLLLLGFTRHCLYTCVPALRAINTKMRKHPKPKEDKYNGCYIITGIIIGICIVAALNTNLIYTTRYKGRTFICVTNKGVYTENSLTRQKHNYSWDDVLTVQWVTYRYYYEGRIRYYTYYCVGMHNGSSVHLGEQELAADYIARHSHIEMSKALKPCSTCDSINLPPSDAIME